MCHKWRLRRSCLSVSNPQRCSVGHYSEHVRCFWVRYGVPICKHPVSGQNSRNSDLMQRTCALFSATISELVVQPWFVLYACVYSSKGRPPALTYSKQM